jgi:hypothetical protein
MNTPLTAISSKSGTGATRSPAWTGGLPEGAGPNVLPDLASALTMNPGLHLLIEQAI